jgi:hypothetical protein
MDLLSFLIIMVDLCLGVVGIIKSEGPDSSTASS